MYALKTKVILIVLGLNLIFASVANAQTFEQTVKIEPPKQGESLYSYVSFEVPAGTESFSFFFDYDKKAGANSLNFGIFEAGLAVKITTKTAFVGGAEEFAIQDLSLKTKRLTAIARVIYKPENGFPL